MNPAKEIISQSNDWITIIFLTQLLVLTSIKVLYHERLFYTSTFFFSKKYLLTYFNKEKNALVNLFQIALFIVQVSGTSLFLYLVNINFQLNNEFLGFNGYLFLLASCSVYFLLSPVVDFLLGKIFNLSEVQKKISYLKLSYFNNLILWMLPFLILTIYAQNYSKFFFYTSIILFVILLLTRYILVLRSNKKLIFNSLFYFILYLCALEIAPLVFILKLTIYRQN